MTSEYRARLADGKVEVDDLTNPQQLFHADDAIAPLPSYQESKSGEQQQQWEGNAREVQQNPSKPTLGQRFHKLSSMAGTPLNKAANFVGAEGWWPTSMEKEATKAARILYSFTRKDPPPPSSLINSKGAWHDY
jgi:hypothetical protein